MSAIQNLYPEAFEKEEYSVKEILDKTTISRKVFDRYKNYFPSFYAQNSRRAKEGNKLFYSPIIYILSKEIVDKTNSGLKHSDVKKYLEKEVLKKESGKVGKVDHQKTEKLPKSLLNTENKEEKLKAKSRESQKEKSGKLESLNEDIFSLKIENEKLKLEQSFKEKESCLKEELFRKEKEIERLNGEKRTLETKVEGMATAIQLLEAPREKENLTFDNVMKLSTFFLVMVFIIYLGYMIYQNQLIFS